MNIQELMRDNIINTLDPDKWQCSKCLKWYDEKQSIKYRLKKICKLCCRNRYVRYK